jgi:hypothetical protein
LASYPAYESLYRAELFTIYPSLERRIQSIDPREGIIALDDHSSWKVALSDLDQIASWELGDLLFLSDTSKGPMGHPYLITHLITQQSVAAYATSHLAPLASKVAKVNMQKGELTLNNQSRWHIDPSFSSQMEKWVPGDSVILGIHSPPLSWFPYLLINLALQRSIPADIIRASH